MDSHIKSKKMEKIKALLKTIENTTPPNTPELLETKNTNTVRVLYIAPKVSSSGYYRMLLPHLELSKTSWFRGHFIGLTKQDFNKPFKIAEVPLLDEWIVWADYIVFPIITADFSYFFKACKVINPELQLIMDLESSLFYMDTDDPLEKKITTQMKHQFLANLCHIDIITSYNQELLELHDDLLCKLNKELTPLFYLIPNLISKIGYQGIPVKRENDGDFLRIGMVGNLRSVKDLLLLTPVIRKIKEKYKEKVTFVVIGWDGVLADGSEPWQGLEVDFRDGVRFLEYFEKLDSLCIDIGLLPLRDGAYTRFSSDTKYLEFAAAGIPVIASSGVVYDKVITHGKTGLLAGYDLEWEAGLDRMITDSNFRKKIAGIAKKQAWLNHSFTEAQKDSFSELFFFH